MFLLEMNLRQSSTLRR